MLVLLCGHIRAPLQAICLCSRWQNTCVSYLGSLADNNDYDISAVISLCSNVTRALIIRRSYRPARVAYDMCAGVGNPRWPASGRLLRRSPGPGIWLLRTRRRGARRGERCSTWLKPLVMREITNTATSTGQPCVFPRIQRAQTCARRARLVTLMKLLSRESDALSMARG